MGKEGSVPFTTTVEENKPGEKSTTEETVVDREDGLSTTKESETTKTDGSEDPQGTSSRAKRVTLQSTGKMVHGVMVLDAIPLFHTSIVTGGHPLMDVALSLVQKAAERDHCGIVGMYVANERAEDRKLSPVLLPVAERVLAHMRNHRIGGGGSPLETHTKKKDDQKEHSSSSSVGNEKRFGKDTDGMVLWVMDNLQLCNPPQIPCLSSIWLSKGAPSWNLWSGRYSVPTVVSHKPYPGKPGPAENGEAMPVVSSNGVGAEGSGVTLQQIHLVSPQPGLASKGKKETDDSMRGKTRKPSDGSSSSPSTSGGGTEELANGDGAHQAKHDTAPLQSILSKESNALLSRNADLQVAHMCDLIPARKTNILFPTDALDLKCLLQAAYSGHIPHYLVDMEDHLEDPTLNFVEQPLSGMLLRSPSIAKLKRY